jgi:anion-transporting  ArsA/GET3 family ATPase
MTDKIKRLYIFTGKGGVGKTTLSFSFAKYLKEQGKKVKYVYFESSSISNAQTATGEGQEIGKQLGIEYIALDLKKCAQGYISKKLKSETIGKWVVKTPFFKALINMIPGFNYLIYLGRILEYLHEDPDLTLVLDSPSSGHALTMLEATHNFSEIFQSGMVFDDTKKMIDLMFSDNFLQVNILTIPTMMAVHESQDLDKSLQKITKINSKIICNNTFHDIKGIDDSTLPDFLKSKVDNELQVVKEFSELIAAFVSHSPSISKEQISKDLVPSMKSLV